MNTSLDDLATRATSTSAAAPASSRHSTVTLLRLSENIIQFFGRPKTSDSRFDDNEDELAHVTLLTLV